MRAFKNEELEEKIHELREEKTRLSEAFADGRIPQDVYKKTVVRVENEITNIMKEMKRRTANI
ncbi:MAG: hypothetical protein WED05_08205 [Candidatus Atabeyarchaeum deiterrae]